MPLPLAVVLLAVLAAGGSRGEVPHALTGFDPAGAAVARAEGGSGRHLREGTDLTDARGVFRVTGDRITFFTDNGATRLLCLENLLLERIDQKLADDPDDLSWDVSGTITEYGQTNYLLIKYATRVQGRD